MEEHLCRICLEERNELTSLLKKCEDISPLEKLKNKLKIEISDDGPSLICKQCLLELENSVKFLEKCENSNRILSSLFPSYDRLDSETSCIDQNNRSADDTNVICDVQDIPEQEPSIRKPCPKCGSRRICVHKPSKIYTCHICQKVFTRKFNFNIHVKRHLGQREWACGACGAAQVSAWLARAHCRARRRRACPQPGCMRSYTSAHNLNTHIRSHTGERPYVCKHCGKKFASKSTLIDHTRIHTGVKPYMCPVCGARFATNKLAAHLRTHTTRPRARSAPNHASTREEGIHVCSHCTARYTHKQSLNRHMRKQHLSTPQKEDEFTSDNTQNQQEC